MRGSKAFREAGNRIAGTTKRRPASGPKTTRSRALPDVFAVVILAVINGAYLRAETLDRVVASVGNTAITASDVDREYRLELFIDGQSPSNTGPAPAVLEQVRSRLIDRVLLEGEVQANGIQVAADDQAVTQRFEAARARYPTGQAFEDGLRGARISEDDLRLHFMRQAEVLRLIDARLRPEATVEAPEIEAYYHNTLIPDLARQGHEQPPPLSDVEDRIREILVQQKINGLLDQWLERLRAARDVKLYGSAQAEEKK